MKSQSIQKQEAQPQGTVAAREEGPVYLPAADILEGPDHWTLIADMPGVEEKALEVTVEQDHLILRGGVTPPATEGMRPVYQEYGTGDFYRVFTLTDEVDRDGIAATLKQGVLRLRLPKAASARPRRIAVASE